MNHIVPSGYASEHIAAGSRTASAFAVLNYEVTLFCEMLLRLHKKEIYSWKRRKKALCLHSDNLQIFIILGNQLTTLLRYHDRILYSYPAPFRQIDARFNGNHHALLGCFF